MRVFAYVFLLLPAVPLAAGAQDRPDPAKALAPYVDELTYAVGVLDVKNLDIDTLLSRFAKAGIPADDIAQAKKFTVQLRDGLTEAGVRHVCFAFNLEDAPADGPLLVIPITKETKAGAVVKITEMLGKLPNFKIALAQTAVIAGSARTLERAENRKPASVPDLAKALAAVDELPTRVALTIPPVLRKSMEESMPRLPKQLGGGPITTLTRGLTWAALGFDLSAEKLQVRVLVQAQDAQAAGDLHRLADRARELLGEDAKRVDLLPLFKGLQSLRPMVQGDQIRLALDAKALDTALLPLLARAREDAARAMSINHLKQIGIAMHNYHDAYKSFPAQASYDNKKKPLLSWRVHILPYIEREPLYKQFKLDEPWDSPNNKALIAQMPTLYRSPAIKEAAPGKTTYLVPAGPDLIFNGPKKTKISQITDGTSNTILVVEAVDSRAVWWTQPEDLGVDRKDPKAGVIVPGVPGFLALFADGSVQSVPRNVRSEVLWWLFCPNDGNSLPADLGGKE